MVCPFLSYNLCIPQKFLNKRKRWELLTEWCFKDEQIRNGGEKYSN